MQDQLINYINLPALPLENHSGLLEGRTPQPLSSGTAGFPLVGYQLQSHATKNGKDVGPKLTCIVQS